LRSSRSTYALYRGLDADPIVASAVAKGRIRPEEIPPDVLAAIQPLIDRLKPTPG
jgi:hypothetical protein